MTHFKEGSREYASFSTKGLETVDLPEIYGDKYQQGNVDYWNYPGNGARLVVIMDRVQVGREKMIVPGVGTADSQVASVHLRNLHNKRIIRDPVIGRPHPQAFVVRMPEQIFPGIKVSSGGVEVGEGVKIDPELAKKAEEIFAYGKEIHAGAGLHIEHAQFDLGRYKDGTFTVVGGLFTPESMRMSEHLSLEPVTRRHQSMVLYHAFVSSAEPGLSSQAEVSNAISLHFNPAGVK